MAGSRRGGGRPTSPSSCSLVTMAVAGSAGVPELLLAARRRRRRRRRRSSSRSAPPTAARRRRRSAPPSRDGGSRASTELRLERAVGGRAQLYRADRRPTGRRVRQGVRPGQPRRRPAVPRLPHDRCSATRAPSGRRRRWQRDVEHEALLLLARPRGRGRLPAAARRRRPPRRLDGAGDGATSAAPPRRAGAGRARRRPARRGLAGGRRPPPAGLAHGALRAANVLVDRRPDRSSSTSASAQASAPPRLQAIDRAELLASLAALVGADAAVASAARTLDPDRPGRGDAVPAAARAVSAATRKRRVEVDASRPPHRDRRGDRARAGAARAAGPGAAPHAVHDRHAHRRVLRAAAAAGQRRREHRGRSARRTGRGSPAPS